MTKFLSASVLGILLVSIVGLIFNYLHIEYTEEIQVVMAIFGMTLGFIIAQEDRNDIG